MKYRVRKIEVIEESDELGSILIERLIERMLLQELGLSPSLQSIILNNHYKEKGDFNVNKSSDKWRNENESVLQKDKGSRST